MDGKDAEKFFKKFMKETQPKAFRWLNWEQTLDKLLLHLNELNRLLWECEDDKSNKIIQWCKEYIIRMLKWNMHRF